MAEKTKIEWCDQGRSLFRKRADALSYCDQCAKGMSYSRRNFKAVKVIVIIQEY